MSTGAWTAACMLMSAVAGASPGTIPTDVVPMQVNRFEIPIKIDARRQSDIRVIELYVSTDQGNLWQQYSVATPDKPGFPFIARTDGVYWFSIVVIDQQNNREPPDIYKAAVGQKILVDTLKPEVRLQTDRLEDSVSVRWEIREEYPDLSKFRLEWKLTEGPEKWTTVPVTPAVTGQASIRSSEAITVRLTTNDAAGNVGTGEVKVPAPTGILATSATGPSALMPMGSEKLPTTPAPAETPRTGADPVLGTITPGASAISTPPLKPLTSPPGGPEDLGGPPSGLPAPAPLPSAGIPERRPESFPGPNVVAVSPPPAPPTPSLAPSSPIPSPTPGLPVSPPMAASSSGLTPTAPGSTPAGSAESLRQELPVINNRKVTMEYEVLKYGPSGVGAVELYVTRDDGLTWKRMQGEHQSAGIPGGDTTAGVLKRNISVDLVEDGAYGFYLVVKSGAGLSERGPRTGDTPHMRVKLDTRLPEAELYRPEQNPTQKDALLISWKANDDNLATNSISVQWAERPTGPWTHIGPERLPNTGSYSWVVPDKIPPQVYLRLTVRDTAGNVAIAETPAPVLIDLIRPILGGIKLVGTR